MPEIFTVIPTFNSSKFIRPCLDSLLSQSYQDFEVIVVDNGSKDNTLSLLRQNYPSVSLIENKDNLGACRARNQGIEASQGEWILTLDCDVILEKDFLKRVINLARNAGGGVGMFQPKILNNLDRKRIYSCGIFLSKLGRFYDIGSGQPDNGRFKFPKYIFGTCSAASLYKRRMLEEIKENTGYFDERFFFLVEDVDLAWRAQKKGWKARFCPQAVCCHIGNSSETSKEIRQYLCWRNRKIFLTKSGLGKFKTALFFILYDLPRLFYLFLCNSYVRRDILHKKASDNLGYEGQ
ncbi:glycosyltransferase family 2 protein [Candidatus Omnitrophota bacterium]